MTAQNIIEEYQKIRPGSEKLHERAAKVFAANGASHFSRILNPFRPYVTHAKGSRKWDVDGNEYIDYVIGHGAMILGHSHPAIVQAVHEQMVHFEWNQELSFIDGRALLVGANSKDPDARPGRAPGGFGRGYKLHVWAAKDGRIPVWSVTPLNANEKPVAHEMLRYRIAEELILADSQYDSRALYDALGGYDDIPLMEDVAMARKLGRGRLVMLGSIARTSAQRYETQGWLRRGAGNLALQLRYLGGADPERPRPRDADEVRQGERRGRPLRPVHRRVVVPERPPPRPAGLQRGGSRQGPLGRGQRAAVGDAGQDPRRHGVGRHGMARRGQPVPRHRLGDRGRRCAPRDRAGVPLPHR